MDKQIFDQPVPFIGPIYKENFSPGNMIRIQGLAPGIAYRFNINLQCGCDTAPQSDVALQVSVHLQDGYISLNSLQDGIWGEEQLGTLPIRRRIKFEIILLCDFNQYKVTINGQHYCEFPHRIHYDRITHLAIDGDMSIIQISYESTSECGTAATSESELVRVPRASAPAPVSLMGNDSEVINIPATAPTLDVQHPLLLSDCTEPPSYEAACRPPYPTDHPTEMPYPNGLPGVIGFSTYPPNDGPLIPSRLSSSAPPIPPRVSGAPVIPPPGAPVPLNAAASNAQPVAGSGSPIQKLLCGVSVTVVIIIVLAFIIRFSYIFF